MLVFNNPRQAKKVQGSTASGQIRHQTPDLSLPRGGGAISALDENFSASLVTGTASFAIKLPITQGRGFVPGLQLAYDSGGGVGAFGLGWSVGIGSVRRETNKRLPTYDSEDLFIFGGQDLVPFLGPDGEPEIVEVEEGGKSFRVQRFRTRVEGGFKKIEFWRAGPADCHWRSWSGDNVVTVLGLDPESRLADPTRPERILEWLPDYSADDKGNVIRYRYKRDAQPHASRASAPAVQVYPKAVYYNNVSPHRGELPDFEQFTCILLFDYGEHATDRPTTDELSKWNLRPDPVSTFKTGFERRTLRLCQRMLRFHKFGDEPARAIDGLELEYTQLDNGLSAIRRIQQIAWPEDLSLPAERMPAMEVAYTGHAWSDHPGFRPLNTPFEDRGHAPEGVRWVDLFGESLPGQMFVRNGTLYFGRNRGNLQFDPPIALSRQAALAPAVGEVPPTRRIENGNLFLELVSEAVKGGFYADSEGGFDAFLSDVSCPTGADSREPALSIDLLGTGFAGKLRLDGDTATYWPKTGLRSYGPPQRLQWDQTRNDGARIAVNREAALFLADMVGDGLPDLVQVASGSIRYWPNLGHGRFGPAISTLHPPQLGHADTFDPDLVRLSDLDGSGPADLLYVDGLTLRAWLNHQGTGWSEAVFSVPIPPRCDPYSLGLVDLLGNGLPSAVLNESERGRIWVAELLGGTKPGLIASIANGVGGETRLGYRTSTSYLVADRDSGREWLSCLHFSVHCLARSEKIDHVTGLHFASEYAYRHGYFDRLEREYVGFAFVAQRDTEAIDKASGGAQPDRLFAQPPTEVRQWFHTGLESQGKAMSAALADEFFRHEDLTLPALTFAIEGAADGDERSDGLRALRGSPIRSETYALDAGSKADIPLTITCSSRTAVRRQAKTQPPDPGKGGWAVFQVLDGESVNAVLDRTPEDARISHSLALEFNEFGQVLRSAAASYPRHKFDGTLPEVVRSAQARHHVALSTSSYTPRIEGAGAIPGFPSAEQAYRMPAPFETATSEVLGENPGNHFWTVSELIEKSATLPNIAYEDSGPDARGVRLVSRQQTYWLADDFVNALPLGEQGSLALGHHGETLAFSSGMIESLFGERVSQELLQTAGYVEREPGTWWMPSGTPVHSPDPAAVFFIPSGQRDPFGVVTTAERDAYAMLVERVTDALGNRVMAINDYRTMTPRLVGDANGNWSAVETDAFGRVVKAATMGKLLGGGTPATGYESEAALDTLANPSARFSYDLNAWAEGRGPTSAVGEMFEEHFGKNPERSRTQKSVEYSGGMGQVVMTKSRTRPGEAQTLGPDDQVTVVDTAVSDPPGERWIGNGRTVFNSQGQPLKTYEPYFSASAAYEDHPALVEQGISSLTFYDAVGRAIGSLAPDRSWTMMRSTPWRTESWDAVDTLGIDDPDADPDLGEHFASLDPALYAGGWHGPRLSGERGARAQSATEGAMASKATPALTHTDALGRTILTIADNGASGTIATRSELDGEGNVLVVIDARGNAVTQMRYSHIPAPDEESSKPALYSRSMDAGESWMLPDVLGRAFASWDGAGRFTRLRYDTLGRPVETELTEPGESPRRIAVTLYGEDAPDAAARNLRGAAWRSWDQAGSSTIERYDHAGQPLASAQRFAVSVEDVIDWPEDVAARDDFLADERFVAESTYDAIGRPVQSLAPHAEGSASSEVFLRYHEGGALARVDIKAPGGVLTPYVVDIDYDAKGQRQFIAYGNGTRTEYSYDAETYRLARMQTLRGATTLQEFSYEYDPVGNIRSIHDSAQSEVYFSNAVVGADCAYDYDAIYRLIEASGREHIDQAGLPDWASGQQQRAHPEDGRRMRRYSQFYAYDAVGNIEVMRHVAAGGNWTRHFRYAEDSNRLLSTHRGSADALPEHSFEYTPRGSMTGMDHLDAMRWNFAEQLVMVDRGTGETAHYTYGADGQRARRVRRFPGARETERLYLGGAEIWRERIGGVLKTERQTLHVMDDSSRVALVETLMLEDGVPVAATEPLARYQLENHLGSASLELDGAGAIISYEEYHPYGTTAYRAVSAGREVPRKRYSYTGKERDEESGFTYHGARYYAPWLGRWTAADPAGMVDGVNWYAYVRGSPVNAHDPDGMNPVSYDEDTNRVDVHGKFSGDESPESLDRLLGAHSLKREEGSSYVWDDSRSSWDVVGGDILKIELPSEEIVVTPKSAFQNFWDNGGGLLVSGLLGIGIGVLGILTFGSAWAVFGAGLALAGGLAGAGIGTVALGSYYTGLTSPKESEALASTGTLAMDMANPISLATGPIAMALSEDPTEGLRQGAMWGSLADGFGSAAVVGARAGIRELQFGLRTNAEVWDNVRGLNQAVYGYGDAASRVRPNALMPGGIERIDLSHWIAQRQFRGTRWAGFFNRPWNVTPMWATEHALIDWYHKAYKRKEGFYIAGRFAWLPRPAKAVYGPQLYTGLQKELKLAPPWLMQTAFGVERGRATVMRQ